MRPLLVALPFVAAAACNSLSSGDPMADADPQALHADAQLICEQGAALPCAGVDAFEACNGNGRTLIATALDSHGGDELETALACGAGGEVTCSPAEIPELPSECSQHFDVLARCIERAFESAPPDCTVTPDDGASCAIDCGHQSATCAHADDSSFSCACTSGILESREFELSACPTWRELLPQCRYNVALF